MNRNAIIRSTFITIATAGTIAGSVHALAPRSDAPKQQAASISRSQQEYADHQRTRNAQSELDWKHPTTDTDPASNEHRKRRTPPKPHFRIGPLR